MALVKITNVQTGPRGLNTLHGPVIVEPGLTVEVEMSDAEREVSLATGWFQIDAPAAKPAGKKG